MWFLVELTKLDANTGIEACENSSINKYFKILFTLQSLDWAIICQK